MAASYVERLTKIAEALRSTASAINDRDNPSDEQMEKAESYEAAADFIDSAIEELECIDA